MYLFFVETKGFTLEELDVFFEESNPRKASVKADRERRRILKEGRPKRVDSSLTKTWEKPSSLATAGRECKAVSP